MATVKKKRPAAPASSAVRHGVEGRTGGLPPIKTLTPPKSKMTQDEAEKIRKKAAKLKYTAAAATKKTAKRG